MYSPTRRLSSINPPFKALVLGDGLGDPAMLDGAANPPAHILRIGFLNYADPEKHIAKYAKVYDIVLLGDKSMDPVNAVLDAVCGKVVERD